MTRGTRRLSGLGVVCGSLAHCGEREDFSSWPIFILEFGLVVRPYCQCKLVLCQPNPTLIRKKDTQPGGTSFR